MFLAFALAALPAGRATAQEPVDDEPLLDALVRSFQTEALTLGMLIQVVGSYAEGSGGALRDGFDVANMRLRLTGTLDGGWSYLFQTNFAASPAILDARIGYETEGGVRIDAGRMKAPVSYELLTYAGSIDFVNRSRVVESLAPGRQIGAQVGRSPAQGLGWTAGVFSGRRSLSAEEALLLAGRLEWRAAPRSGADDLIVAVNGGYAWDNALSRGLLPEDFRGDGWVSGLDLRYTFGRGLIAAEVLGSRLNADDGSVAGSALGHHLTGGWMWAEDRQVLLRWDRFDGLEREPDDALVVGLNVWPTAATEVQVNYLVPVSGDASGHQLLVNLQLGF